MDVTVYLQDELGARAKGLPRGTLSRLLRDALTDELERRDAMAKTLTEVETYELELEDGDGHRYKGRVTGKQIAGWEDDRWEVFLTVDERVILYDARELRYDELNDPAADLSDLPNAVYIEAMQALGEKPVIDL